MCAILSLCLGARWLTCVSICQFSSLESVRRGSPTTASPGIVSFHSDAYAILCMPHMTRYGPRREGTHTSILNF